MTDTPVAFDDIEMAFEFVSADVAMTNEAWLDRTTGIVHWHNEFGDLDEPLPEDIEDDKRYLAIPHKNALGLGKPLVLEFTRTHLPECYARVRDIFSRRGAYARFKDLLDDHGYLDVWHQWEDDQSKRALRDWCEANDVKLADSSHDCCRFDRG